MHWNGTSYCSPVLSSSLLIVYKVSFSLHTHQSTTYVYIPHTHTDKMKRTGHCEALYTYIPHWWSCTFPSWEGREASETLRDWSSSISSISLLHPSNTCYHRADLSPHYLVLCISVYPQLSNVTNAFHSSLPRLLVLACIYYAFGRGRVWKVP